MATGFGRLRCLVSCGSPGFECCGFGSPGFNRTGSLVLGVGLRVLTEFGSLGSSAVRGLESCGFGCSGVWLSSGIWPSVGFVLVRSSAHQG